MSCLGKRAGVSIPHVGVALPGGCISEDAKNESSCNELRGVTLGSVKTLVDTTVSRSHRTEGRLKGTNHRDRPSDRSRGDAEVSATMES